MTDTLNAKQKEFFEKLLKSYQKAELATRIDFKELGMNPPPPCPPEIQKINACIALFGPISGLERRQISALQATIASMLISEPDLALKALNTLTN